MFDEIFCKVTKKRVKCKRKACFYFPLPSASNFGEAKLRKSDNNAKQILAFVSRCYHFYALFVEMHS